MKNISVNEHVVKLLLRLSLAFAFLSAVADRFGLWGAPGSPNVGWGAWTPFLDYVKMLNPLVPNSLIPALGWIATLAEIALAIGLIVGWKLKWMALGSGALLLIFALEMTFTLGIKAPFDYSVFTAASSSVLLYCLSRDGKQVAKSA